LEKERMDEIQVISGACEAMGREIYEVSFARRGCDHAYDRSLPMGIVCSTLLRINCVSWGSYRRQK
jgi:hypothetical protein